MEESADPAAALDDAVLEGIAEQKKKKKKKKGEIFAWRKKMVNREKGEKETSEMKEDWSWSKTTA